MRRKQLRDIPRPPPARRKRLPLENEHLALLPHQPLRNSRQHAVAVRLPAAVIRGVHALDPQLRQPAPPSGEERAAVEVPLLLPAGDGPEAGPAQRRQVAQRVDVPVDVDAAELVHGPDAHKN
ncbi:hypothetical protein BN1708_012505 [Verticillium longisporum]|uniref:Uncharacterized protein n=1 Tax=Verticillium longisporum TaxID=100787 RepID=A0A0G4LAL8_VERLO|nr:hypothetical protein BN1708_012505 [Verticillium longisporum]